VGQGRGGRAGIDPARHARFQPLLLVGGAMVVAPTIAVSGGAARWWSAGAAALAAAAGAAAWWWGRSAHRDGRRRDLVAMILTLVGAPALVVVVWLLGAERPEAFLPVGAALVCAMAPVTRRDVRVPVQATTVALFVLLMVRAGRGWIDVVLATALLASVAVLATALAAELVRVRRRERAARRDAQRRAELLAAVRDLPGNEVAAAAAAACAAMRDLGFEAAGCAVRQGEEMTTLHLDGVPVIGTPRVGEGLVGAAVAEDRTIVVGDYQLDPRRLAHRPEIRSAVVAPIRVDGRAAGTLMGARRDPGDPRPEEVEITEVLAAHLGAVFSTAGTVRRQRDLLDRMHQLDTMRSGFLAEVSDDLRDPLTVVRGTAATLAGYADRLSPEQRTLLLDRLTAQADQLRRTIDALLDFSRFHSSRSEALVAPVPVGDLLGPVAREHELPVDLDPALADVQVRVDAALVGHAIELLATLADPSSDRPVVTVARADADVLVHVGAAESAAERPELARYLAAQLLVAGGGELVVADGPRRGHVLRLPVAEHEPAPS
jgi:signal transduction histidine kinase